MQQQVSSGRRPKRWSQGAPKFDQNGAQERSESDPGTKASNERMPDNRFSCILVPLVRLWAPFWAKLGATGLAKSYLVGTKASQNFKQFQPE